MLEEEIIYLPNKVQSELSKGTTQISDTFPLYESFFSLMLHDPTLIEIFKDETTYGKLVEFQKSNKDHMGELIIPINNFFQRIHFSDGGELIRIKDMVERIKDSLELETGRAQEEEVEEITPDEKEIETIEIRNLIFNAISNIFDTFNRITFKKDEINLTSLKNHNDESLKVEDDEKKKFREIEKLTDRYFQAQEEFNKLSPEQIKAFLDADIGRYDAYYSVQELVLYLLRAIYNVDFKTKDIADKPVIPMSGCIELLAGIPVFSLNEAQRNTVFIWYQERNWPLKSEFGYYEENHKKQIKVGFEIFKWLKEMIEILKKLSQMERNNKMHRNMMNKAELKYKVNTDYLNWAHFPLTSDASITIIRINSLYEGYGQKVDISEFVIEAFDQNFDRYEDNFNKEYINASMIIFDVPGFSEMVNFPKKITMRGGDFFSGDFEYDVFTQDYELYGYVLIDEVNGGDVLFKNKDGKLESVRDKEERKFKMNEVHSVAYIKIKKEEIKEED